MRKRQIYLMVKSVDKCLVESRHEMIVLNCTTKLFVLILC